MVEVPTRMSVDGVKLDSADEARSQPLNVQFLSPPFIIFYT